MCTKAALLVTDATNAMNLVIMAFVDSVVKSHMSRGLTPAVA